MHAADQRFLPRRYAAPAVAMAAAAAVAVAPVAYSAGAITTPPIVQDLSGAASAVANWATATGLKFVTDPITGLTKLVTDQVGNATVIGGVLGQSAQDIFASVSGDLPKALTDAQKLIEAGKYGEAWTAIANTFTGPVLGALLNGMGPIMGQLGPQIGPFADAFQSAMLPIIGLVLPSIALPVTLPSHLLDGVGNAATALQAGDPVAALNALVDAANKVGQFTTEMLFGDLSLTKGAIGLLPAILAGMAGSSWAGLGPFATAAGTPVSFGPASTATLAASPTALPALPDFGAIGEIWTTALGGLFESLTGPGGIKAVIDAYAAGLPQGQLVEPYGTLHSVFGSALLGLMMPLLPTGQIINPYLGPIGNGLDGAQGAFIGLGIGAFVNTQELGTAFFKTFEDVGKALTSADPEQAINALLTGSGSTATALINVLVGQDEIFPGILPSLVSVGGGFVDGVLGKTPPVDAAGATVAGEVSPTAGETSRSDSGSGASEQDSAPAPAAGSSDDAPVSDSPSTTVDEVPTAEVLAAETPAETSAETQAETPAETPSETPAAEKPAAEETPAADEAAPESTTESDVAETAAA